MIGIIVEKIGNITTIGINRPSKRNCFDNETVGLMQKALENFEADTNSYVAVLHGLGGSFCSGFDMNNLVNINDQELSKMLDKGLMVSGKCLIHLDNFVDWNKSRFCRGYQIMLLNQW